MPAAGANVIGGTWLRNVKFAVVTLLWLSPGAVAIALIVVLALMVIGAVYCVDVGVGVDPSRV